ncbi:uncharacterized protein EDB91DRAFT_1087430 [Suillus paluster]|uniref:uncharacterized protein n=1 Tax=Suillus paluster TaxID=48578 RepID=UPI001B86197D|nr:uncharacterized protein EDB91DRAFT_1087430 [Suillus paluster]KAG1724499.1 hypothetical protein EDB91DRAFT_1087430 [Suillus paluster]
MSNEDPNITIRPDFTLIEHHEARQQLVNEGLTDEQAACSLTALWTVRNNADKMHEEEEEEQQQQTLKDEEEAARQEERKKNKAKYVPLIRAKVPSDLTIIPAQYTTRRLKAGEYCELHYFTNRGLNDAKTSALIVELDTLVMLPSNDRVHSWVPAAVVKDPRAAPVVKNEQLTWEDFNEAAPRMIMLMRIHDWPNDRVQMHVQFWTVLQEHHWRHTPDPLKQRALLLYQSQQRRRWHLTVGTAHSWSLEEINQDLLLEVREDLFNEHHQGQ